MARAHGDSEAVDAGLLDEGRGLLGMGKAGVTRLFVLVALADVAKLRLDGNADGMGDLHDLLRLGNVLVVRKRGAVDHDRAEAGANGADKMLERTAVIEVQRERDVRVTALIEAGELAHLLDAENAGAAQDDGGVQLVSSLQARFHGEAAEDVRGGDSVMALLGVLQKFVHRC